MRQRERPGRDIDRHHMNAMKYILINSCIVFLIGRLCTLYISTSMIQESNRTDGIFAWKQNVWFICHWRRCEQGYGIQREDVLAMGWRISFHYCTFPFDTRTWKRRCRAPPWQWPTSFSFPSLCCSRGGRVPWSEHEALSYHCGVDWILHPA